MASWVVLSEMPLTTMVIFAEFKPLFLPLVLILPKSNIKKHTEEVHATFLYKNQLKLI